MKTKRQRAEKMLSNEEKKHHVSPYSGAAWNIKIARTKLKVIQRVKRSTIRRMEREIAKDKGTKVSYSIK